MQTRVAIGMGSNLGDRHAILDRSLHELGETPGVHFLRASRFFETAPIGGPPGQGPFLNAAALYDTTLRPEAFHGVLKDLENRAGRLRRVRWGERTLDLDLLLFGDRVIESETLVVPHPRMAFRRFVLGPLVTIAPDAIHPVTGRSIAQLLDNLAARPLRIGLFGWDAEAAESLAAAIPDFSVAKSLETLDDVAVRSIQFLVVPRTSLDPVASTPAVRPIPTLRLDPGDLDLARQELCAACLSAR